MATAGHPNTELHRRDHPRSNERAGVDAECQEECAFSSLENHISWRGVGFDNDAGMSVSCSYRIDSHSRKEIERKPVSHCRTVSETVSSDGSCV